MKPIKNRIAARGGTYSLALTAIVLAILVAVNALFSALPSSLTRLDISSTQLYSVTSNTKVVMNALDKDVTVYWIVQADEEDNVIENLLSRYEALSSHIEVVKKNPDAYPTFAAQYTDEDVPNNSLIVECGSKSRYISYNDIYLTDIDYNTYSYVYSFDGEGALTSAIDYVVSDELPQVYQLTGHGEADLPDEFAAQLEKENMTLSSFSLLTVDAIPEQADTLLLYAPASDLSADEVTMLEDYLQGGGKLLVISGATEGGTLETLRSLLSAHGVKTVDGLVVDTDREHYALGYPYVLLPDLASDEITDPLLESGYHAIFPLAQGMTVTGSDASALLTTSDAAYSKAAGYELTTYEREDGDSDGPFALAVRVSAGVGEMIWFSSDLFLEPGYNAYASGANLDLAMNALASLIGQREAVSIRSKSLSYNYLTISASSASLLKAWMIGVVPGTFVLLGVFTVIDRRKKRHA